MNRADKIALGYIGTVVTLSMIAAAKVIADQDKEIKSLRKRNRFLKDTIDLVYRLNTGENVKDEVIDHVIKHTDIPNDPRDLNQDS